MSIKNEIIAENALNTAINSADNSTAIYQIHTPPPPHAFLSKN
jgi:hypothetical protein